MPGYVHNIQPFFRKSNSFVKLLSFLCHNNAENVKKSLFSLKNAIYQVFRAYIYRLFSVKKGRLCKKNVPIWNKKVLVQGILPIRGPCVLKNKFLSTVRPDKPGMTIRDHGRRNAGKTGQLMYANLFLSHSIQQQFRQKKARILLIKRLLR